jgi:hypothetical protein
MSEGGPMSPSASAPAAAAEEQENIVHLSPDMLPSGASPKSGDKLVFVVSGDPDQNGDIPGYFEASEPSEPNEESQWAEGMRKAMSPQAESE